MIVSYGRIFWLCAWVLYMLIGFDMPLSSDLKGWMLFSLFLDSFILSFVILRDPTVLKVYDSSLMLPFLVILTGCVLESTAPDFSDLCRLLILLFISFTGTLFFFFS